MVDSRKTSKWWHGVNATTICLATRFAIFDELSSDVVT
jgi:hypothetical protein